MSARPHRQGGHNPPADMNNQQQQAKFDQFITEYKTERRNEALNMNARAERYRTLSRIFRSIGQFD